MGGDPLELYTKDTKAWIEDPHEGWINVIMTSSVTKEGELTVQKDNGELVTIKLNKEKTNLPPLDNPAMLQNVDDLTTLSYLHEPAVLHNIKVRYAQRVIYTYSGIVLVAINPFQKLNIYGHDMVQAYAGRMKGELEPHLFSVAEDAFRSLVREGKNQSIIVTGESGAGKTVSTKFVMRFFATVESEAAKMSDVEEQVLATNPIMESFGNAKTIRNNNSSRFGKYIEIKFSSHHKIVAAHIRTFLLERSRVVFQAHNERGYHIFYQLCAGAPLAEREELGLGDTFEHFHYLSQGGNGVVDEIDDNQDFKDTQNALSKVGMSVSQQWKLFRLLAGLLHLGNIEIGQISKRETDSAISLGDPALVKAMKLLSLDPDAFVKWICKRNIQTKSETIVKNRDREEAKASRDAIAKFIYSKLFDWLVSMINRSLSHPTGGSKLFIGLLDIYGFEIFKVNSFEQFCINYANEKLQQEFVQHVFKLEQQEYVREGISWSFIDYRDNQPCIDLIEAKLGILGLLDEECRMPKGSDEGFINKLYATLKDHAFFAKPRFAGAAFVVKHYAQDVCYEAVGFLEKNKDTISDEQMNVLLATKEPLFAEIFGDLGGAKKDKPAAGGPQSAMKATLGSTFKASLTALMETLRSTTPNYIRCIKPNEEKAAFVFEPIHVLSQLRACGVLETIRISAAGYPSRTTFPLFAERYRVLAPKSAQFTDDGRAYCKAILDLVVKDQDKYQVGKTKIFLRAGQLAFLERLRLETMTRAAVVIQKYVRRMQALERYKKIRRATAYAQKIVRGFLARRLYNRMRMTHSATLIQKRWRGFVARQAFKLIKEKLRTIVIAIRAKAARKIIQSMKLRMAAITVQRVFRGHLARKQYKKTRKLIVFMQCCLRRRKARLQLKLLRVEARSLTRYKEVSYKLENKVVELTQILKDERLQSKQAQSKADSLAEENTTLRQKLETLKPYKEQSLVLLTEKADLERQLQEAKAENASLVRKVADRDSNAHQKAAEFEAMRTQLEGESKHYKTLYETLLKEQQALQTDITKERADWAEKSSQQKDKLQRIQGEFDVASHALAQEKEKSQLLEESIDRLQSDTSQLDGLRQVLGNQLEEMERQTQQHAQIVTEKEQALQASEEERNRLLREVKSKDEALAHREGERAILAEQFELARHQVGQLIESLEEAKTETAQVATQKHEAEVARDSLLTAKAELKKASEALQSSLEEQKRTSAAEMKNKDEQARRLAEDYEMVRRALESEQSENATLKERLIRMEAKEESAQETTELKNVITSNMETSYNELKKFNMSLMESHSRERDSLNQTIDMKESKIKEKESELQALTLQLEEEKHAATQAKEELEGYKREVYLKQEMGALKNAMAQQEIQLQVKLQQQQVEQQETQLSEASKAAQASADEIARLQASLQEESQIVKRLTVANETLKREQDTETMSLRDLLASKTAELEKMERRYKEEIAMLEVKFEEERRGFSKIIRKATSVQMSQQEQPANADGNEVDEENWFVVPQIRGQSKDWQITFKGDDAKTALGGEFEREFVSRIVTRIRPPVFSLTEKPRSQKEVLFPAHLTGIALSRMVQLNMQANFHSLLVAAARAIGTIGQQKKDDLPVLCFWLSNVIELRSMVYSLQGFDRTGAEVPLSTAAAKTMTDLGQLVAELFQLLFQKIKSNLVKIVAPAILMHDHAASSQGFARLLKLGSPTPQTLTQQLSEVKILTENYFLDKHTTSYLFSFILYTIGTEALNNLLLKKELCTPRRGLDIRFNSNILAEWCQKEGFPEATLHLKQLSQAAGLLQHPHRTVEDIETLLDSCFLLNSLQVHKLLANFRDDTDGGIAEAVLQFVYQRTLDSGDEVLLEQGRHAPFENPPSHVVHLIERYVPPNLQLDDIMAKLGETH